MANISINKIHFMIILLSSLLFAFLYNYLSPSGLPLIREPIAVEIVDEFTIPENEGNRVANESIKGIDISSAIKLFESGDAVFIDARDQWDFAEGHIPGAINIPEFSFEPDNETVKELSKTQMYVIYCDGDDCDISKRLAVELSKLSFTNLYVYLGGFNEWRELGYAIEKSELE